MQRPLSFAQQIDVPISGAAGVDSPTARPEWRELDGQGGQPESIGWSAPTRTEASGVV
jgi:hypothetical protein